MTSNREKGPKPVDPRTPLPDAELEEQAFTLLADFQNYLRASEGFEEATSALYFGLTDSGEPADPQERVVGFWVTDGDGNDTIRWDIIYHFEDRFANMQRLIVRRTLFDDGRETELKLERLDLKTKRFPGLKNGPKSSIEYRSDSPNKTPETVRSNSRNAVEEANSLLNKLGQDTNF